jgi:hypothetical protein
MPAPRTRKVIAIDTYLRFVAQGRSWQSAVAPDPCLLRRAPANCNHFAFLSAAILSVSSRKPVLVIASTCYYYCAWVSTYGNTPDTV